MTMTSGSSQCCFEFDKSENSDVVVDGIKWSLMEVERTCKCWAYHQEYNNGPRRHVIVMNINTEYEKLIKNGEDSIQKAGNLKYAVVRYYDYTDYDNDYRQYTAGKITEPEYLRRVKERVVSFA
jgi:hypothetical protein